jgi:hypothetical protein
MLRAMIVVLTVIAIYDHVVCNGMLTSAAVQMTWSIMNSL